MGLFSSLKLESMNDLFEYELEDLYDAEKRLTKALPKMIDAASSEPLKQAFRSHLTETKGQVQRLEQVFKLIGKSPTRETCDAMKGLISEGEEIVSSKGSDAVRDAALIAAAQRVEHYEMAGYGTLRTFAQQMGREDIAAILDLTLQEEKDADCRLTSIAQTEVNCLAEHATSHV